MAPYAGLIIATIFIVLIAIILFFVNAGQWNALRNKQTAGSTVTTGVSASDAGILFALNLIWGIILSFFLLYLLYILYRDSNILFGNGNTIRKSPKVVYTKKSIMAPNISCPVRKPVCSTCEHDTVCPLTRRTSLVGL